MNHYGEVMQGSMAECLRRRKEMGYPVHDRILALAEGYEDRPGDSRCYGLRDGHLWIENVAGELFHSFQCPCRGEAER